VRNTKRTNHPADPRLLDIVHSDAKLFLVFEFLDLDLKKYMDTIGDKDGLGPNMVKVGLRLEWAELSLTIEIHLPTCQRPVLLSRAPRSAPGSQAPKLAHQQGGQFEDCR